MKLGIMTFAMLVPLAFAQAELYGAFDCFGENHIESHNITFVVSDKAGCMFDVDGKNAQSYLKAICIFSPTEEPSGVTIIGTSETTTDTIVINNYKTGHPNRYVGTLVRNHKGHVNQFSIDCQPSR